LRSYQFCLEPLIFQSFLVMSRRREPVKAKPSTNTFICKPNLPRKTQEKKVTSNKKSPVQAPVKRKSRQDQSESESESELESESEIDVEAQPLKKTPVKPSTIEAAITAVQNKSKSKSTSKSKSSINQVPIHNDNEDDDNTRIIQKTKIDSLDKAVSQVMSEHESGDDNEYVTMNTRVEEPNESIYDVAFDLDIEPEPELEPELGQEAEAEAEAKLQNVQLEDNITSSTSPQVTVEHAEEIGVELEPDPEVLNDIVQVKSVNESDLPKDKRLERYRQDNFSKSKKLLESMILYNPLSASSSSKESEVDAFKRDSQWCSICQDLKLKGYIVTKTGAISKWTTLFNRYHQTILSVWKTENDQQLWNLYQIVTNYDTLSYQRPVKMSPQQRKRIKLNLESQDKNKNKNNHNSDSSPPKTMKKINIPISSSNSPLCESSPKETSTIVSVQQPKKILDRTDVLNGIVTLLQYRAEHDRQRWVHESQRSKQNDDECARILNAILRESGEISSTNTIEPMSLTNFLTAS
jgi:hypothetical protein